LCKRRSTEVSDALRRERMGEERGSALEVRRVKSARVRMKT
jgi:hypothetical protein